MWVYCDRDSSSNSNNNNNNNNRRVVLFARGAGATALVTGAAKNVGNYHDNHDNHDREEHEEHEGKTTQEAKEAEQEENSREGAAFQWSLYLTPAKEGYRLMFQTSASKEVVAQKDEGVSAG